MSDDAPLQLHAGFQTELRAPTYGGIAVVPSTGDIGRHFLSARTSLLTFTNPFYNVRLRSVEPEPLGVKAYRASGSLEVLNIGCGGCADIPLFEEQLRVSLRGVGVETPTISTTNADKSETAIGAVKNGEHPYFLWQDFRNVVDRVNGDHEGVVRDYIGRCFDLGPMIETQHVDGSFCVLDDNGNMETIKETRQSYRMKPEVRNLLKLQKSDICDMPFGDGQFNVVICSNVLLYLDRQEQQKAKNEIERVMKENGLLLADYGLYQKQGNSFARVSGRISPFGHMENMGGILPTAFVSGNATPFGLEDMETEDMEWYYINGDRFWTGTYTAKSRFNTPFSGIRGL